ncbi:MAG: MTAP family purine nucleoside phosphorylase [Bdellovibrionota bacterium]
MLAVVGGTGLYKIPNLEILEERLVEGPFGAPSGPVLRGKIASKEILFLARHGGGHSFLPHEINYRANIYALKSMGAKALLSVSAVGSLRENYKPGDLVAIDQYIDLTKGLRKHTYFGDGIAAHLTSAHPVSQKLKEALTSAATQVKLTNRRIHSSEKSAVTYACVEGPRLGTRAESLMLRNMGADLVGMTNVPEVFWLVKLKLLI